MKQKCKFLNSKPSHASLDLVKKKKKKLVPSEKMCVWLLSDAHADVRHLQTKEVL